MKADGIDAGCEPRARARIAPARARWTAQEGYSTIAVMGIMAATLLFASVAATASVTSMRGSVRDEDSKVALAAADAGAAAALAHQNSIAASTENPCLAPGTGGVLVSAAPGPDGWCPPITGAVDGGTYSYQVAAMGGGEIRIISVGDSDGVNRRIELSATDSAGSNVFADASVMGIDWVHMDSNAKVYGDAASNGDITLDSNAKLCGGASVGVGRGLTATSNAKHLNGSCGTPAPPVTQQPLSLPPVQQGDVVTNNSNSRLFGLDLISGNANKVLWDPVGRRLELRQNVAVTLGGINYSFCQLKLSSNSELYIAEGAAVSLFFDSPESCGGETTPLAMHSNSKIIATGGNSTQVRMLFVGSDTVGTNIELSSNAQPSGDCSSGFVLYAPKSHVQVNSNVTYCGAMAGRSIELDSNAVIEAGVEVPEFQLPGAGPHYTPDRFVECTATSPGTTGEGC